MSWSQRVSFAPPNPGDTQSFNRYSYARNNPLSCIDRNGFDDAPADPGTLDPIYVTCCTSSNDGSWNNDPGGAGDIMGGSGGDFRSYLMAGYFSYDFNSSFLQSNYDALYGAAPLQGLPGSQSSDAKSNPATETIDSALPDLIVTASRDVQLSLDISTSLIGVGLMDDTLQTFFGDQPAPSGASGTCPDSAQQSFFDKNFDAVSWVADKYSVDPNLLLGLAAYESTCGTSSMAQFQNNPFGATPGGDSKRGLTYGTTLAAWVSWGNRLGPRLVNVNDSLDFIENLLIDNRNTIGGTDMHGGYNSLIDPGGDPIGRLIY